MLLDGASAELFIKKISSITVTLGPSVSGSRQATGSGMISNVVMTMAETIAAPFRTWKQQGGQRDVTIQSLSAALNPVFSYNLKAVTIDHIHPAAPVGGEAEVTLKVGRLTFGFL